MRDSSFLPTTVLCVLLSSIATSLQAQPQPDEPSHGIRVAPKAWLLEQMRLGEARYNESRVDQAMARLDAIAPDDPQVLEAKVRQALRRDDIDAATRLVERLAGMASDSDSYRRAQLNLALTRPEARRTLSQARLLSASGRLDEAKAAYDALFSGAPPTLPLAIEYWQLLARLPSGTDRALRELQALDVRYPRSSELGFSLARLLISEGRDAEAEHYLARLAKEPSSRTAAARLWRDALRDEPASNASVAAWERFLSLFSDTEYAPEARRTLDEQQNLLAKPAYRARQRGLAQFSQTSGSAGEADIQQALSAYPKDVELLGALGIIYLRQGRHAAALDLFQRAQALDTSAMSGDKWNSLSTTARYWQLIKQGSDALADNELDRAEQAYRRASRLLADAPQAWQGIGDVARQHGDTTSAKRAYQRALRLAPNAMGTLERLVELHASQSPQRALAFITSLTASQQHQLDTTRKTLRVKILQSEGEQWAAEQQWDLAAQRFAEARTLAPGDIWLTYALAQALRRKAKSSQGDAAFADLLAHLTSPEARAQGRYAQALYLASDDRNTAALASLQQIPTLQRDADIRALETRLERTQLLRRAERLREAGEHDAARRLLVAQPMHADSALRLGSWALTDGNFKTAKQYYRQALSLDPERLAASLGLVETALAQGDETTARKTLETLVPATDDLDARRRVANAWAALGETARAQRQADALVATPGAGGDALLLRDTARLAAAAGDQTAALARYRQALATTELDNPARLADDTTFTRALRTRVADSWLKASLRSEAAALYQGGQNRISTARLIQNEGGTEGVSALTTTTDMLELDTPLGDNRGFLRLDRVVLDAGRLKPDADGFNRDVFGTCAAIGCSDTSRQQDQGVSIGLGWYNETWRLDVGTTPLGFAVTDWVAGIHYSGAAGPLWTTASASRRPLDDSLLSYAGAEDPNTGTIWGGVRATGARFGLGYDQGGANGFWSSLEARHLEGKRMPDNWRVWLMGGAYHKLVDKDHQRLSTGLNAMTMHYAKNLGGYSLGQGGYYSPQRYLSLSLPMTYRQRTSDWSLSLEGAISHSWTNSDPRIRYPFQGTETAASPDAFSRDAGGRGGGLGFSMAVYAERRLTGHWRAGLTFSAQKSEGYAPNAAQVYLRFTPSPWQGDLDLPPTPLEPHAEWE